MEGIRSVSVAEVYLISRITALLDYANNPTGHNRLS